MNVPARTLGSLALVGLVAGGCGATRTVTVTVTKTLTRAAAPVAPPAPLQLPPGRSAVARAGAEVITQAGCLACHRLATTGNDGPGPPLDAVGARMAPRAIRRALIHAIAPMPSYRQLAPRRLRALVAYLSQLS